MFTFTFWYDFSLIVQLKIMKLNKGASAHYFVYVCYKYKQSFIK